MERAQWVRWVNFYEGPITKSIISYHLASGIAADTQSFLSNRGLTTPVVFTADDEKRVQSTLKTYNTIGRLLVGVHAAKYGIRLTSGDIDILAPKELPEDEWAGDVLGLGAVPLVIWALAAGAVLVAGLWAGSAMMKSSADRDFIKYKKAVLQADKQMMKQAPDVRRDWAQRRKDFEKEINKTEQKTGVLVDIFGAKGGAALVAAAVVLLALFASRFIPKDKNA